MKIKNPIQPFLEHNSVLIVDGALATELEARGHNLNDELWSARLLQDDPMAIKQLHFDYLAAGADCIISASYQATIPGFMRRGMSEAKAVELLQFAVQLALKARDEFWRERQNREGRLRPIVAASVGPYGAFLADGSEYSGDYGLNTDELLSFHRQRWHILARSAPDIMACETIPSAVEANALLHLLPETPQMPVWMSFSCRDHRRISDGTPLANIVAALDEAQQVVAVGINCTAPRFIPDLIATARRVTQKPIVVYPNSGETYDVQQNRWFGVSVAEDFAGESKRWRAAGASLIGGCCRTGPQHIQALRRIAH